jgi:HEPN domain-containing protein
MIDTATAFFLAGERCEPDVEFGPYDPHSVSAPTIVCFAFSVELALKLIAVIACKRKVAREHSLKELFLGLPQEYQDKLAHTDQCIEDIDRYFTDWRYSFEHDLLFGETSNPRRAFIECYRLIREIRPELKSVYEENWGEFQPDWVDRRLSTDLFQMKRVGTND